MTQRSLIIGVATGALALTLTACGSSSPSQDQLDQARKEGAAQAHTQDKIREIQNQLKDLKHGGSGSTTTSTGADSNSGGSTSCGGNLSVGTATTCAFARNVQSDYHSQIGSGSGTVRSYSPTTNRVYTMYCTAGTPHSCTGGNNASVYFP